MFVLEHVKSVLYQCSDAVLRWTLQQYIHNPLELHTTISLASNNVAEED